MPAIVERVVQEVLADVHQVLVENPHADIDSEPVVWHADATGLAIVQRQEGGHQQGADHGKVHVLTYELLIGIGHLVIA